MIADFRAGADYHPILELTLQRTVGAHRTMVARARLLPVEGGDGLVGSGGSDRRPICCANAYLEMLNSALADPLRLPAGKRGRSISVMDRLHPYLYFLEGLTAGAGSRRMRHGVCSGNPFRVANSCGRSHLRLRAPMCMRSLLRARIYGAATIGMNTTEAAEDEAAELSGFQAISGDRASTADFSSDGATARCRRM